MISAEEIKALMKRDEVCPFCGEHKGYELDKGVFKIPVMICRNCDKVWNKGVAAHQQALSTLQTLLNQAGEALGMAKKRVEYLGVQHPSELHYLSNIRDYLPQFDEALAAIQPYMNLVKEKDHE